MTGTDSGKVFLDTAPIIYYLEKNDIYYEKVRDYLRRSFLIGAEFQTSAVTVEEYHVFPFRNGDSALLGGFRRFIDDFEVRIFEIDYDTALTAARLRAAYPGFKAMDALQLACAIRRGADIFLTNDTQLRQCGEIRVMLADELSE